MVFPLFKMECQTGFQKPANSRKNLLTGKGTQVSISTFRLDAIGTMRPNEPGYATGVAPLHFKVVNRCFQTVFFDHIFPIKLSRLSS
jgi:hypothetical protein